MSEVQQKPAVEEHDDEPAPTIELPPENTKAGKRVRMWQYLEKNDLVNFPRPCTNRIPNVKEAVAAGDSMKALDFFKKAKTIKVNPDKPQQQCRYNVLDEGKRLLVPTPRLRTGLFNVITPPENYTKEDLLVCSRAQGVKEFSTVLSLEEKVVVDLVIVGCVAVSKEGFRIGKGEGYADLDWAMMTCLKAVTPDTVVVTTCHDDQIIDIPEELVKEHDLVVDYIVTPTQVITCPTRKKPAGICWDKLTRQKLKLVPILKRMREWEREAGVDVELADEKEGYVPTPRDERKPRTQKPRARISNRRERPRRSPRPERERPEREERDDRDEREPVEDGKESDVAPDSRRRRPPGGGRGGRRRERRRTDSDRGPGGDNRENREPVSENEKEDYPEKDGSPRRRQRPAGPRRPRRDGRGPTVSVYVGGLPRDLRVSEFKAEVRAREVAPLGVIWHGGTGHAFLIMQPDEADAAVTQLEQLTLHDKVLRVEMAHKRSRRPRPVNGEAEPGELSPREEGPRSPREERTRSPREERPRSPREEGPRD